MTRTSSGVDPEALWITPARSRLGRPPAHSRAEITAVAVAIADTDGLAAATMRRIAATIGTGAMSLYTYVPDKETLLELMIDHVVGEWTPPGPTGDWRADLLDLGHGQHELMSRHPWLPEALPFRQTLGPSVLASMEYVLAVLEPTGLSGKARLEIFGLLTGFIASYAAQEHAREKAGISEQNTQEAQGRYLHAVVRAGTHPHLARLLADHATEPTTFDHLLTRMIEGLVG